MKEILKFIGITMLIIVIIYFLAGFTGLIDLQFSKYFGVKQANVQREIFTENKTHVEGMASDLAKYKYEYEVEKDEVAKKAIAELIRSKFANFDANKLENFKLQMFLKEMRGF
jgi:hypothetical protein